jgi:hypothetical protein
VILLEKEALDILDLGILMLVVALCVVTGVTSTFMTNRRAYGYNETYMQDKNTTVKNNAYVLKEYGSYDASLSRAELMLITQIQDSNMPSPKNIKIHDTQFNVNYTYKENLITYGQYMVSAILSDGKDTRYLISYEYEIDNNGKTKNSYFNFAKTE